MTDVPQINHYFPWEEVPDKHVQKIRNHLFTDVRFDLLDVEVWVVCADKHSSTGNSLSGSYYGEECFII